MALAAGPPFVTAATTDASGYGAPGILLPMPTGAAPLSRPALRPMRAERATADGRDGLALIDPVGIAEPVFVPAPLVAVVARFDGTATPAAIAAAAGAELRQQVPVELVEQVAADLDRRLLLVTARYLAARDRRVRELLDAGVRPCRHAGSAGYPADAAALRAALRELLPDEPVDPRAAPLPPPRGLIAPHIDLARGVAGYRSAYRRLLRSEPADLYVIFGTGHQGPLLPLCGLPLDWQTPLGRAATDRDFVAAVHEAIGGPCPEDLLMHAAEHSIEFQVLLLQHVAERRGDPPPRVAAFLCGRLPADGREAPAAGGQDGLPEELQGLLAAFRAAARASGGRVCYLAGADLAHLGPLFGDGAPVDRDLLARLDRDERARLSLLEQGRPGAFHRAVEDCGNPDRVCSAPAITLAALLAEGSGELLHYGQAAAGDGSQVVGFCAMAFAAPPAVARS